MITREGPKMSKSKVKRRGALAARRRYGADHRACYINGIRTALP